MFSIKIMQYSWYRLTFTLAGSLMKREFGAVVGIHGDGKEK